MTPPDRRPRGLPDLLLDLGPVVALLGLGVVLGKSERGNELATALVVTLPLLLRRRWPLPVLAVVAVVATVTSTHVEEPWVQVGAVLVASFAAGSESRDRTPAALVVLLVASLMAIGFLAQDVDPAQSVVLPFVVVVPSWLLGDIVRTRRLDDLALADDAARAARDQEQRVLAAVTDERRRMARELHDVVAHGVSVMLIQAGAARQVIRTSPDQAEEALLTVEATGREAMAELRRLLGVLNDDGEATSVAPQPGLGQRGARVDRVREAGLPADLTIDGAPGSLPASLDTTIYRIVQEALTNALRYARRAATLVRVTFDETQVRVEILDDGPSPTGDASEGSGRGLIGMRQRAEQAGGRLEAGPRLGGGYAVRAWLPLEGVPTPVPVSRA